MARRANPTRRRPRRVIDGIVHAHCNKCLTWKPRDQFNAAKPMLDGTPTVQSDCKVCRAARLRRRYHERRTPSLDETHYVSCMLCVYPFRRNALVDGLCSQCQALLADEGMHPDDTKWCDQARSRLDSEVIMAELKRRAKAGKPLFPNRRTE